MHLRGQRNSPELSAGLPCHKQWQDLTTTGHSLSFFLTTTQSGPTYYPSALQHPGQVPELHTHPETTLYFSANPAPICISFDVTMPERFCWHLLQGSPGYPWPETLRHWYPWYPWPETLPTFSTHHTVKTAPTSDNPWGHYEPSTKQAQNKPT